jgi:hypothetical protein
MSFFTNWLRHTKHSGANFVGVEQSERRQETPQFIGHWNHFRNSYDYEYGKWAEVEKAAKWPDGKDINDFFETMKERLRKTGAIPQVGWHKAKLWEKMRKIMPEHGHNHSHVRELAPRMSRSNVVQTPQQMKTTGPTRPDPTSPDQLAGPNAAAGGIESMERRIRALEARLQGLEARLQGSGSTTDTA